MSADGWRDEEGGGAREAWDPARKQIHIAPSQKLGISSYCATPCANCKPSIAFKFHIKIFFFDGFKNKTKKNTEQSTDFLEHGAKSSRLQKLRKKKKKKKNLL